MFNSPFTNDIAFVFREAKEHDFEELTPKERLLLSEAASDKRKAQFANGRLASAMAFSKLGIFSNYIAIGNSGEPVWQEGITGSITHSGNYAAVAVTKKTTGRALGIDLEQINKEIQYDIREKFCTSSELEWINKNHSKYNSQQKIIILFSCKESVYKAIFHLTGAPHRFKLMQLTPKTDASFDLTLLGNLKLQGKEVGFKTNEQYVLSYTVF